MNPTLAFVAQATLSLLSFGLIARWVIYPRLRTRTLRDALTPLLLFETLRTVGLIFIIPSVIDAALPATFTTPATVGDLLAVFLAFVALIAVRAGWRAGPALAWLFSVEGLADFINATAQGLRINIAHYHLGIAWFIPTYAVPLFVVVQLMVIAVLLNAQRQHDGERRERQRAAAQTADVSSRLTASIS